MKTLPIVFLLWLIFSLSACMPLSYPPKAAIQPAILAEHEFVTQDDMHLPVKSWLPAIPAHAVIIALHGFNDYSHFFDKPGAYFSQQGIVCFAYDQRGFGAAPLRGLWAGSETYADDLQEFVNLVKQRYPDLPIYLLGESMGGAVVITAISQKQMPELAGVILVAPALWARSTMPWYQTSLLWTLAHTFPWLTLTGRGLHVMASDNIDMLRAMGRDPLVIKATRVETIYGLTNLMDKAYELAPNISGKLLLLYGERDEIIPKAPTYAFAQQLLANTTDKSVAIYPEGYHMLLRDLQAQTVWQDITVWVASQAKNLPSAADNRAKQILNGEKDG